MPDYSKYKYDEPKWGHMYHPCKEEIPADSPEPRGKMVITTTFKDANLLFDYVKGRSVTGVIHLLNKTPIDWFCKRQITVETSTYGSDFTAVKVAIEQIMEIRYSLRMLGVPLNGPSILFGDNKSVVDSVMIPSYRLNKRHNVLVFHRAREAVACGIVRMYHIDGKENPADILTKHRSSREWYVLMRPLLCWAWRDEKETHQNQRSEGSVETQSALGSEA